MGETTPKDCPLFYWLWWVAPRRGANSSLVMADSIVEGRASQDGCTFKTLFKKVISVLIFKPDLWPTLWSFDPQLQLIPFGVASNLFSRKHLLSITFTGGEYIYLAQVLLGWTVWNSISVGQKWLDVSSFSGSTQSVWGTLNIYRSEDFRADESHQDHIIVQLPPLQAITLVLARDCPVVPWQTVRCGVNCQALGGAGLKGSG